MEHFKVIFLNAHNYTTPFVNQVTYGYGNFSTEATKGVQVNKSRTLKSIKNNKILLFDRLYSHGASISIHDKQVSSMASLCSDLVGLGWGLSSDKNVILQQ